MFVELPLRDPMEPTENGARSTPPACPDALALLRNAASAEEFFATLGVAYDPKVVHVARLHILKRMGEYLAPEDIEGAPAAVVARCKAALERAYSDFVASPPRRQRVFKILKQAGAAASSDEGGFVPLEQLAK